MVRSALFIAWKNIRKRVRDLIYLCLYDIMILYESEAKLT